MLAIILPASILSSAQEKPLIHLRYEDNYTPTYDEVIDMYQVLDAGYKNAVLIEKGPTDSGKPLHLFVINDEQEFNPAVIKAQGKAVLLINNGIHAGEPAGIDASLQFADDILRNKDGMAALLKKAVVVIVPAYNIGGLLNRSAYHRANQTTPYETGFRGNAANLDLNRDFTRCDSENSKSFTRIFHEWDPDVFLDTHTTNGSDHQYSITLIAPPLDMFPPVQELFLREKMLPALYEGMKKGTYELIPYVDWFYDDPRKGIQMTREGPRYSSGYARLFHSYGMITETLVYKPYADRVKSTIQFIQTLAEFVGSYAEEIRESRKKGIAETRMLKNFPVAYELDSSRFEVMEFKGYEFYREQESKITGLPRPGYNTAELFTDSIKYYNEYRATEYVAVPEYYILPQAWRRVVERLVLNGVEFYRLRNDTTLEVVVDYIEEFSSPQHPYNGHYYHEKVITRNETQELNFYAGDLIIPVRQEKMAYVIEMLEPKASDSFFRWNFFDAILDNREYFSSYGFEENAMKYLREHPDFNREFQEKRKNDKTFASDHRAQLNWIYYNSEWAEKSHRRYPAGRLFRGISKEMLLTD
ncbi:MAG: M14 family zinc carboxypeptidase [Mariniphaga sp.]